MWETDCKSGNVGERDLCERDSVWKIVWQRDCKSVRLCESETVLSKWDFERKIGCVWARAILWDWEAVAEGEWVRTMCMRVERLWWAKVWAKSRMSSSVSARVRVGNNITEWMRSGMIVSNHLLSNFRNLLYKI